MLPEGIPLFNEADASKCIAVSVCHVKITWSGWDEVEVRQKMPIALRPLLNLNSDEMVPAHVTQRPFAQQGSKLDGVLRGDVEAEIS